MDSEQIGVGSTIGGFKIESELGRGGMGVVYKAHELSLNRKIAMKVLSQRLSFDDEFVQRFQREARVVAALSHPNIVNILSYGEEAGHYYFAMEMLSGTDLRMILKKRKEIPIDEALSITIQIADALGEAAARGVVHRDLKPSNIMIDEQGRVKVTDFGIACFQETESQLTRTGLYMGTPEYSSPEQARGANLDVRSDIFSLGAILYKMLSGVPFISGESPLAVMAKILTEPIIPIVERKPSLPPLICALVDKMMAKEIGERFQSPADVIQEAKTCLAELDSDTFVTDSHPQPVRESPVMPPKESVKNSKRFGIIAGIILAILLSMWSVDALFNKVKQEEPVSEMTEVTSSEIDQSSPTQAGHVSPTEAGKIMAQPKSIEQTVATDEKALRTIVAETEPVHTAKVRQPMPVLPEIPIVLMFVSGDQSLTPFVRAHLEALIVESGLKAASISEIPVMTRKMQMGDIPFTWHDIQQFVPQGKANIIVLAEAQKTGSMPLEFYGRRQELTSASFSIRAIDIDTGVSAAMPVSGTAKFTPLTLDDELRRAVSLAASGMGPAIKMYWRQKRRMAEKSS